MEEWRRHQQRRDRLARREYDLRRDEFNARDDRRWQLVMLAALAALCLSAVWLVSLPDGDDVPVCRVALDRDGTWRSSVQASETWPPACDIEPVWGAPS